MNGTTEWLQRKMSEEEEILSWEMAQYMNGTCEIKIKDLDRNTYFFDFAKAKDEREIFDEILTEVGIEQSVDFIEEGGLYNV